MILKFCTHIRYDKLYCVKKNQPHTRAVPEVRGLYSYSNNFLVRDKIIILLITLIFSEYYGKNS